MTSPASGRRRTRFEATLERLRTEIERGRLSGDDMLPGERELAEVLSVSRTTLRRMLAVLVEDGLLRHRQGVGTFVTRDARLKEASRPSAGAPVLPSRLAGFTEEMQSRGWRPSSHVLTSSLGHPGPEEAMMLACSPQSVVLKLARLRLADGVPVALDDAVVPSRFLDAAEALGPSLFATLDERGFRPVRALHRVGAVLLAAETAHHLQVEPGSPAIQLRSTAYLADGPCCVYTRSIWRADRYDSIAEVGEPAER